MTRRWESLMAARRGVGARSFLPLSDYALTPVSKPFLHLAITTYDGGAQWSVGVCEFVLLLILCYPAVTVSRTTDLPVGSRSVWIRSTTGLGSLLL